MPITDGVMNLLFQRFFVFKRISFDILHLYLPVLSLYLVVGKEGSISSFAKTDVVSIWFACAAQYWCQVFATTRHGKTAFGQEEAPGAQDRIHTLFICRGYLYYKMVIMPVVLNFHAINSYGLTRYNDRGCCCACCLCCWLLWLIAIASSNNDGKKKKDTGVRHCAAKIKKCAATYT